MISSFITNATGTLVPTLLACAITYLLLMTVSERTLANRVLFYSFLLIWMVSTVIGYIIPANNTVYVAFSFAVLGTLLLLIGKKKQRETDASDRKPEDPE
jgi:Na+/melibiose symporter-like transporter